MSGDEERDPGDEDLSLSRREADDDARSFDGTFKCEPDGVVFCNWSSNELEVCRKLESLHVELFLTRRSPS